MPAPFEGKIVELLVEDGAKVTARQKLYKLEKGAEAGGKPAGETPQKQAETRVKEAPPQPPKKPDSGATN